MEKPTEKTETKNTYDFMIEKLKAAAFPVLVGVVIWMGKDLLTEIKDVAKGQQAIIVEIARVQANQSAVEKRIEMLEAANNANK